MISSFEGARLRPAEQDHDAVFVVGHPYLGFVFLAKDQNEAVDWMRIRKYIYKSTVNYETRFTPKTEISFDEEQIMLKRERIEFNGKQTT